VSVTDGCIFPVQHPVIPGRIPVVPEPDVLAAR
jgi:hypothetical protein